jgi:1-acyl-sn-glycerol-3-phosphate acyltransferase
MEVWSFYAIPKSLFSTMNPYAAAVSLLKGPANTKAAPAPSYFSPWLMSLVYPLGRYGLLPAYFKSMEVMGQEHLPKSGPMILAPTHRARWDALMVPYAAGRYVTGRDLRFMVTASEVVGFQGLLMRNTGAFPVDTDRPAISSLRHGMELLQRGEILVIFPEGNLFYDREIQPLKPGLARLALQTEASQPGLGLKVVPMALHYDPIQPRWRSTVSIRIGAPLHVDSYEVDSIKRSAQVMTNDLEAALKKLAMTPEVETTRSTVQR